jgi:AmmeMemoRadiSam system protein A
VSGVVIAGIAPHPPILLPEVGRGEERKLADTAGAMAEFTRRLKASGAETLVIISPHGSVFSDGIAINGCPRLTGDLKQFRAPQVSFEFANDPDLAGEIIRQAARLNIAAVEIDEDLAGEYGVNSRLDHGVMVPVYFLEKGGVHLPMVSVSMGLLPFEELYAFGVALRRAAEALDKKIAVVASGDLSHRLTPDAPAGYSPDGKVFDAWLMERLKELDIKAIVNADHGLAERAGECGLRTVIMMLGALDSLAVEPEVLSYEGPFGVGYLVAAFAPGAYNEQREWLEDMFADRDLKVRERREKESPLVQLARQTLETYVREGRKIKPPAPLPEELQEPAGVFVSLKKHGQLRGCIGTTGPTTANIAEEIINNAISAGVRDPRFNPVRPDELADIVYSVDVLKDPEPVDSTDQLDVKKYGVIVRSGRRSGLLLPNLEGVDTVEEQVAIARQKAGIGPDEPVELERFEVVRYY